MRSEQENAGSTGGIPGVEKVGCKVPGIKSENVGAEV